MTREQLKKPKIVNVGCGHWGKNLVKKFSGLEALDAVCDSSPDALQEIQDKYLDIKASTNVEVVIAENDLDGVTIATPAKSHYSIAKKALNAGKHVFVEKPFGAVSL
jgi:predicted dehydrogenase